MNVILQVEDTESDVFLLQEAALYVLPQPRLALARDGAEAVAYLRGDEPFANRQKHPMPNLVLLDMGLPCVSGLEVLEWIRARPEFERLPVIMLTSCATPREVEAAYAKGASGYVVKPSSRRGLAEVMRAISYAWLQSDSPWAGPGQWFSITMPPWYLPEAQPTPGPGCARGVRKARRREAGFRDLEPYRNLPQLEWRRKFW